MGLETASFISELDSANPSGIDDFASADNHLRLIKSVLKSQFPNLGPAAVVPTEVELNFVDGVTSAIQAQLDALAGSGGGKEISDIVRTELYVLPDGKVLLDCDGALLTPASFPLLEAALAPGVSPSLHFHVLNSNGDKLDGGLVITFSQTNSIFMMAEERSGTEKWEWMNASSKATDSDATKEYTSVGIADDGVESIVSWVGVSTSDLGIEYNLASAAPTTSLTVDSVKNYVSNGQEVAISADGAKAIIVAVSTANDIEVWTSGANIGTGYSNTSTTTPGVAGSRTVSSLLHNPTLTYLVFNSDGIWISDDSGATWKTEESILSSGHIPSLRAIDSNLDIYATETSGSALWRSSDDGATWIEEFNVNFKFVDYFGMQSDLAISGFDIDASDNWYLTVSHANNLIGTTQSEGTRGYTLFYSEDEGVTWQFVFTHTTPDQEAGNQINAQRPAGFRVLKDGSSLYWMSLGINNNTTIMGIDLAHGKVLPLLPMGFKIVADAP